MGIDLTCAYKPTFYILSTVQKMNARELVKLSSSKVCNYQQALQNKIKTRFLKTLFQYKNGYFSIWTNIHMYKLKKQKQKKHQKAGTLHM